MNIEELKAIMNKEMVRPSNAEMSEIPDVSREYILDLENECNALREVGLLVLAASECFPKKNENYYHNDVERAYVDGGNTILDLCTFTLAKKLVGIEKVIEDAGVWYMGEWLGSPENIATAIKTYLVSKESHEKI